MTSPTSARSWPSSRGFTLIELVIVIMVIALLAGILLPMVLKAQRTARKTRTAADLQTISIALDAYRMDFGDYPRPDPGEMYSGFAVLGRALVSPGGVYTGPPASPIPSAPPYASRIYLPGECVAVGTAEYLAFTNTTTAAPPGGPGWMPFVYSDGAPGPGFRARPGGKIYPAYLQPEKFKMQGVALLDLFGNPILYYPARPAMPKITAAGGFLGLDPNVINTNSLYNFAHNPAAPTHPKPPWLNREEFARLLGDGSSATAPNGMIDAGESAAHTGPFLLWSAGDDRMFGFVSGKIDDVANFAFRNLPE